MAENRPLAYACVRATTTQRIFSFLFLFFFFYGKFSEVIPFSSEVIPFPT